MRKPNTTKWYRGVIALVAMGAINMSAMAVPSFAQICDSDKVGTPEMFQCEAYSSVSRPAMNPVPNDQGSPVTTYTPSGLLPDSSMYTPGSRSVGASASFFPRTWPQHSYNQRHNPVFSVPANAPDFLKNGTFWAAPLTGLDFLNLGRALNSVGDPEEWGSTTSQYLGNVVGASVARGMVFVQNGRRDIWAVNAENGKPIWRNEVTTAAGMGQSVIEEVGGRLMVFSPVGDAAFTVQNAIDFTNNRPHYRGGNFAGIHAFDGLTGKQLWRFPIKGSGRPTPVYRDGKLYVNTNNNQFFVLDAATGKQLGAFTNPGNGFSGLAAANWIDTADGRRIIIYGTIRPTRILGVDVTNPTAPKLAWSYTPPGATANAPGDTSAAVDPALGLVFTTVFTNKGTATAPIYDLNMVALNATTGALVWSHFMGEGDSPPGYKGSIPMVHDGVVYAGNTSDGTFQAFNAANGTRLWVADLHEASDKLGRKHRPRAAAVFYDGKLILAEGRDIHTFDPKTGVELNRFETPGFFGVWGINQPVIVGKLFIQSSISGWVFATPVDFITSSEGMGNQQKAPPGSLPSPPQPPEYLNLGARPSPMQARQFPNTSLAYAGGQTHNNVVPGGPSGIFWQTALKDAFPLSAPPLDEALYGKEVSTHMMHQFVGVGSGVSPVNGVLYAGSDRFSVYALNASTGKVIWRARTQNANFGQPIVTPDTIVVGGGDPWLNLGGTGQFKAKSPTTKIGDNWGYLRGLRPETGVEKWTVYSGLGTSSMTPLYSKGNLYWVNGQGRVWAVSADKGEPVGPFMDDNGLPVLSLGGFNAISSANVYHQGETDIMVVGLAMPNRMVAINLSTGIVMWTQTLASAGTTYLTGFAGVPPAVDQHDGLVISTVLVNADETAKTITQLAFALNVQTGAVVWTKAIATGPIPVGGFVGPTPLLDNQTVYLNNPLGMNVVALDIKTGANKWQTPVTTPEGKFSWGPGALVDGKLIQPVGPSLYTFKASNGTMLNKITLGGSMTYNHPSVVGNTLFIGNSWGWVTALPLKTVTGSPSSIGNIGNPRNADEDNPRDGKNDPRNENNDD